MRIEQINTIFHTEVLPNSHTFSTDLFGNQHTFSTDLFANQHTFYTDLFGNQHTFSTDLFVNQHTFSTDLLGYRKISFGSTKQYLSVVSKDIMIPAVSVRHRIPGHNVLSGRISRSEIGTMRTRMAAGHSGVTTKSTMAINAGGAFR
ncbi:MAG: hypothetical protein J6A01_06035 [Proteobacteria bacterium]|nr:hypothetical protein [Pseudomonadota bacterium]